MSESKIELKGFDEFFSKVRNAPAQFEKLSDKAIHKTALQIRSFVVAGIANQTWASKWAPLSPKYKAFKILNNGSNKMLISGIRSRYRKRTKDRVALKTGLPGNYRNSFESSKLGQGVYAVGSNYPQARALELGNPKKKLPARPHLQFAVEQGRSELMKNVVEAMKGSF